MQASHQFGRRASLFVLAIALAYSACTYLSSEFLALRLFLSAYGWPVLRAIFVLQMLIGIGTFACWSRPLALRWLSLSSISLAVVTHTVLLVLDVLLTFYAHGKITGFIIPLQAIVAILLFACLAFSLTRTTLANESVNSSGGLGGN